MTEPNNEKILITGASSYVGAGIHEALNKKYETVGTYHKTALSDKLIQLDTTNRKQVFELIDREKPTTIIHAAGAASLKWCLEHPEEAKKINEDATRNIIEAAKEAHAGVIFISSFAAINPDNPYALSKVNSEKMVKDLAQKGVIIRPTVVLGISPNTKNDKFMNRILSNITSATPPVYDNTWKIQPTDLSHLSQVISAIIDRRLNGHTIPVVTEKLVTYFDIARDILNHFGIKAESKEGPYYPPEKDDRSTLIKLGLPLVTYDEMIKKCVNDISNILKK